MQSQTGLNYAKVHPVLRSAKNHRQLPKKQNKYSIIVFFYAG